MIKFWNSVKIIAMSKIQDKMIKILKWLNMKKALMIYLNKAYKRIKKVTY